MKSRNNLIGNIVPLLVIGIVFSFYSGSLYAITMNKDMLSRTETLNQVNTDSSASKKINVALNSGFLECLAVSVGYPLSDNWQIAIKGNFVAHQGRSLGGPPSGKGIGLRITKRFNEWFLFNYVSLEPTYLLVAFRNRINSKDYNGSLLELNAGHEILEQKSIHFFWAIGGALSLIKTEHPMFFPTLKLGINYQF